jgi:tape measure domain-containing protein
MADAAQLKLQVGLDLAFFRQQLAQLGNTAAGYALPINIDRLGIQKEITKLGKNISGRKYTLKITSGVSGINADIIKLQNALENLGKESVNIQVTGTGNLNAKEARKIRTDLRASILANGGKIKVPATITAAITKADITAFKNAVKSKLNGVSVDVKVNAKGSSFAETEQGYSGLTEFMKKQGLIGKTASGMTGQMREGGDNVKQQLNDAVQSAQKIKSIFDGVAQSIATTGKSTATIQGKRLGLANVPLMVGGVEKKIERSSAAIGGTTSSDALKALYPEVSKTITSLAALKGQIQQNTSKLSGFSLIIALAAFAGVPLAKSVVKLTGSADNFAKLLDELGLKLDAAFTKAASSILSAASSRLLGGGSVAGLLPPAYRGIGPSAGPSGLLPPAYRGLPPAYRGIGPSAGAAGLLSPAYRGIQPSAGAAGLLPPAYRGIGPSRNAGAIGGTAFGSQKYLPTALGDETKKVLRDAAHAFLNVMRQEMRAVVYQVGVQDLGNRIGRQAMLPGRTQGPLMLPAAGGTTPRSQMPLHSVSTGAYVGQPPFMQAPSIPPSMAPPLSGQSTKFASPLGAGYFEVGKGLNSIKAAYDQAKTFLNSPKFPVTGAIAGLGGEFGNAVKQVLLFGTAYKALAFLTSLPGEAFEAAKALATYRNQLEAVTTQSQTFDKSLAFVDNLAARFNVPLDSARQGFVKLYASMEPAGFKQGQIENLFTGISKAAAAFGLSSDKVDRVNYAFAQMASKGQIMSEELKGQLGDVLPGALGLFAEAAQMTIPEFSKAMEDGAFKGGAMEQVLNNVSILLNNKFSKAASGASKTLQGAVNQIQNNLKLMYESFTPIVNGAAAAFGPQINGLIKDITATMKVLTSTFIGAGNGFDTLSPRAQAFYTAIKTLEPSLRQAGAAIVDLGGRLAQLIPALVQVLAATVSFAASPLGRAALLAAVAIGTLTASLAVLEATGIKAAIKSVYKFIGTLLAIPAASGAARVAIISLKLAITGLVVGGILLGLDFLISKLFKIGDAAQDSTTDLRGLVKQLDEMTATGDLEGLSKQYLDAEKKLAKARNDNAAALVKLRKAQQLPEGFVKTLKVAREQAAADTTFSNVLSAQRTLQAAKTARANAIRLKDDADKKAEQESSELQKIDLSGTNDKKQNLESYYSLLDDLAKATTQAEVDRAEAAFNHQRDLINAEYDYREARANSFQAKAIAFQREIFNIVSKQEEESLRNRNKIKLAAGSVSGLSPAGGGPTVGGSAGLTSYITGDPSQKGKGYQPDHGTVKDYHDHLAFATRELAIQAYKKLTAADIKVTEFKGYGKGVTGPHSGAGSLHHQGLAMDVPGYQWGGTGAIGAKEYAGSARVRQVMGIGGQASAEAPRKVPGSEKREEISQRKTNLLTSEARAAAIEKEARTTEELRVATERYIASLLPTAEQGLQNQLLEQKINLTRAGASPSILEAQLTYARQELEVNETIRVNTLEIEKLTAAGGKNSKVVETLTALNIGLKASLPVSAIQLLNKTISEQTLALVERTRAAKRDAEDQSRINNLIISGMTRQAAEAKIAADNLRKDYKKALEEATRQVDIAAVAFEVLAAAKRLDGTLTKEQTAEYQRLAEALKRAKEERDKLQGKGPKTEKDAQEAEKVSTPIFGDKIKAGMAVAQEELTNLTNVENILVKSANNIGNAFGAAFGQIIDGSMSVQDALGSMFKQIGQDFINMAMEIIAKQVTMIIFGMLMKALGLTAGASGGGKGLDFATMDQYTTPVQTLSLPQAANGAMFSNGIAKFATGGIVNGPTLFPFADGGAMQMGLMGEAGPEAIMPLQRGSDGSLGVRAAMGGNGMGGSSSPILNMNFETSTINGVEYVSRDQLEAAMAQTRRQASSDGAKRGMAMTLDKIQQSPQTRRRIGM